MITLNVKFQEKYKQLDTLCKDMFKSKEGVSVYIKEMELTDYRLQRRVSDWDTVYNRLKHMRWVRNKLAHEEGAFYSDICTEFDLKWLDDFYNTILKRDDPLAIVGRIQRNMTALQSGANTCKESNNIKVSLWGRIKAKFKRLFL